MKVIGKTPHKKDPRIYLSIHVRKEGPHFPVFTDPMAIKDKNNNVLYRATSFQEINKRKRVDEPPQESEEQVRLLLESTALPLYGLDIQGNCTFCNPACFRVLGYNDSQGLLGQNVHALIHHTQADGTSYPQDECRIYTSFRKGESVHNDTEVFWRADGSSFPVEYWSCPVWREGRIVGAVVTFWDITERLRLNELEQRTSDMTLLSELGSLLQTCMTAEEAYGVIAQSARKLFPSEAGAVCVLAASRNLVEVVAVWKDPHCSEQVFSPDDCWALRSCRAHFVDDPASPSVCRHLGKSLPAASLCIPMMAQGEAMGVLHIQSNPNGQTSTLTRKESLSASKQQLARAVAEQIALPLANLRLRETLRMLSIRDPLTGLFNRRFMEESLERELRRAVRYGRPLGTIMLDLDNFKTHNDTFGHEAGDTFLRNLGNFLAVQVRGEDLACRYGGDEFIVLLPGASLKVTLKRADRLREQIKHLRVAYNGQSLGPMTLSLGAAVFPEHASTAECLLRAADEALYRAKKQGRDQVSAPFPSMPKNHLAG